MKQEVEKELNEFEIELQNEEKIKPPTNPL